LSVPRLHVVTTREVLEAPGFVERAAAVLSAGGLALHLRAHGDNGRLLLERAAALRERGPGTLLVNDRVDVARLAGAGAHLPEAGLTPAQARAILGRDALLGRSVHGARAARGSAPLLDFLIFGHVFATRSKPGRRPRGLRGLARVVGAAGAGLPVLAIGGVTPERVASVRSAGAYGVAVLSGIWGACDPAQAAGRYLAALEAA
jgi:thiamine-phosphate diphosphorylase